MSRFGFEKASHRSKAGLLSMHIFPRPTSLSLHLVHATRHFNGFITKIHTFLSNLIESSEHFLHDSKMGEPRNLEKRGNEWSRDVPQQPI